METSRLHPINMHMLRLKPGEDLKQRLMTFTKQRRLKSGIILTAIGSLKKATLRLAGAHKVNSYAGPFEICAMQGTLSLDGLHLHITIADSGGITLGGHLMEGSIIETTAEIAIGVSNGLRFNRTHDEATGYKELIFEEISQSDPTIQ